MKNRVDLGKVKNYIIMHPACKIIEEDDISKMFKFVRIVLSVLLIKQLILNV